MRRGQCRKDASWNSVPDANVRRSPSCVRASCVAALGACRHHAMPDRLNRPPLANPMRSPKVRGDSGGLYWVSRVVAPLLVTAGFGGNAAYPELPRHFWRSRMSDGASVWMERELPLIARMGEHGLLFLPSPDLCTAPALDRCQTSIGRRGGQGHHRQDSRYHLSIIVCIEGTSYSTFGAFTGTNFKPQRRIPVPFS